ncbi:hypothetical protein CAEBREN_10016 [Caenorhabditis brenneri]|uniref:DUF4773 domain-containing protein n=1 Tax=Caenorhabditis brenneri TaxID=135651 RepID=G0NKA5_CAEBE|nr:hypothetical protein CAEBREN_10016 [Caenorhabditis brenneri]
MRVPLVIVLLLLVLIFTYKAAKEHKIISFTATSISETLRNSNSSFLNGQFKLPDGIRKIILQLEETISESGIDTLRNESMSTLPIVNTSNIVEVTKMEGNITREKLEVPVGDACQCIEGNCACCLIIDIPEFSHSVCVNATYNPETIGLNLSIGVDGHYFSQEISLKNPPPFCFSVPIPGAEPTICVAVTHIDVDQKAEILSGCIDLEIELLHLRLINIDLECFKMPI